MSDEKPNKPKKESTNKLLSVAERLEDLQTLTKQLFQTLLLFGIGVLLAVTAAKLVFWPISTAKPESSQPTAEQLKEVSDIPELKSELRQIKTQLQDIQQNINDIAKNPNSVGSLQQKTMNDSIIDTQNKLASMEKVLVDNPSKALEMPLLRRDMDNLKSTYQLELSSTRQEVDRIYDQNKWFLGVMVTILLAVVGLIGTTLLKKPAL